MTSAISLPGHEEEILWSSVLGCERKDLYSGKAPSPTSEQREIFDALALRRLNGEPLQYLTGVQGFRKLELEVGLGVLVPRPETEMVVERCLDLLADVEAPKVVDVGTGSGAIALAIATERPDARIWAVESSSEALVWARRNLRRAGVRNVELCAGDLFRPVPERLKGRLDLVVSNPPYLSKSELSNAAPDVRDHEPRAATVAGPCGLELYPALARGALEWLLPGGWLVLETAEGQWGRLRTMLSAGFLDVGIHPDLTGSLRVAEGRKP